MKENRKRNTAGGFGEKVNLKAILLGFSMSLYLLRISQDN
jgi:hypothetical protein